MRALQPDFTYVNQSFVPGLFTVLDDQGMIVGTTASAPENCDIIPLPGRALLPGFVNGHSHAFQRAIRGRTHGRVSGKSDFWSWREAMYQVVEALTPESVYAISKKAFVEMLEAGFTSVGEFHYVHHGEGGVPYSDPNALAKAVIQAAVDAGIRITLLRVVYLETGFEGTEPSKGQLRFMDRSWTEAKERIEALSQDIDTMPLVSLGVAPHSVRAVHLEEMTAIGTWAKEREYPLHVHAGEQVLEVEHALQYTGKRPIELLDAAGCLGPRTTVVHGTHLSAHERERIAESGTTICVCPTTEADLGDGLIEASLLSDAGVPFSLGSDSQAQIDPFEEMRCLESHERLRTQSRTCLVAPDEPPGLSLLRAAIQNGATSLGYGKRAIEAGLPADLVSVSLSGPELTGIPPELFSAGIAFHGTPSMVQDVWVQGERVVKSGTHKDSAPSSASYLSALRAIFP